MRGEGIALRIGARLSWLLLISAVLAILLPLLQALGVAPVGHNLTVGEAHLSFTLSHDRVFLPSECVTARWQVEGIREVYFNGEGVTGEGERTVCPAYGPAALRVVLQDGSEQSLILQAPVTSVSAPAFVAYAYALTAVLVIIRWGSLPVLTRAAEWTSRTAARFPLRLEAGAHWLLAHPLWVVAGITLAGAALRFTLAGHRPLVLDEAVLETIASGSISQVVHLNAAWNSAPPLFALVTSAILLVGNTELLLRAVPLLASILVIPAFYVLARRFFERGAAYLATLALATALMPVYYAHYLREYSLTQLLSILALLTFLDYRAQPTRRRLIVLAACWMAAILTQYGLALLILPLNLWLLLDAWRAWRRASSEDRRRLVRWTGALQEALLIAVSAVFVLSLRDHLRGGSFAGGSYLEMTYWNQVPASLPGYLVQGTLSYAAFAFGAGLYGAIWDMDMALLLTSFGVLSTLLASRGQPLSLLRPLVLFAFALAALFGVYRLFPYSGGRQTIYLSVLIFLLMGAAFQTLLAQRRQPAITAAAVIAALLIVFSNVQNVTRYYAMPGYDDASTAAAYVAEHWEEGDRLLLVSYSDALFEHYFLRPHPDRRTVTSVAGDSIAEYGPMLEQLRADPGRIWVVLARSESVFEEFIAEQPYAEQVDKVLTWTNIHVYLIAP